MFEKLAIRLSKLPHLVVLLGALTSAGSAWAEAQPKPSDVGTFLGRTVACGCVSADEDIAFPVYLSLLTDKYGETFADQAHGHMKLALREAYDNQIFICRYVCERDVIAVLQEALDNLGPDYEQARIAAGNTSERADVEGNYGNWQMCYWRPNSPICKDIDDPASPVNAQVASEY